ncbi:hypothetical protein [Streptomyces sp. NPDC054863]
MSHTSHYLVLALALLAALLLAALTGVVAALLARWDGVSWPGVLSRGGVAFGSALAVLLALVALLFGVSG